MLKYNGILLKFWYSTLVGYRAVGSTNVIEVWHDVYVDGFGNTFPFVRFGDVYEKEIDKN